MQIILTEINTALLHPMEVHKIWDAFFAKCGKISKSRFPGDQKERDRFFSQICESIAYPEHYLSLARFVLFLTRRTLIRRRPSFLKFLEGIKQLPKMHSGKRENKLGLCNHVWNLYQDIKVHGILEPVSVVYEKKPRNIFGAEKYEYGIGIGNSRFWVAKKFGIKKIKCIVFDLHNMCRVDGKRIEWGEVQSYFKTPITIEKIKSFRDISYIVTPQKSESAEDIHNQLHWAEGCV